MMARVTVVAERGAGRGVEAALEPQRRRHMPRPQPQPCYRLSEDKESSPCLERGEGEARGMRGWCAGRRVALDVAMALWGVGTWLGVNGLYVQLPLLVERLPERWALPSAMVLAVQLANTGLLAYAALRRLLPRVPDAAYIYALLAIGTLALLLNAFLYEVTTLVGGQERSIAYLTLTFFAALVGCTSSVLFYPYLRHFRDVYLATYLVGEGLGGFLSSILALIQGVGVGEPQCVAGAEGGTVAQYPPPRFDSTVFLVVLGALSGGSLASFALINKYRGFDSERVAAAAAAKDEEATARRPSLAGSRWLLAMGVMAALNALSNGVLPSLQSYSCMPYGGRTYHLAATLSTMANPAACLAGVWLRPLPARALAAALLLAAAPLAHILATALLSPAPPLLHSTGGAALIVICWVLASGVVSYGRMWVYGWARGGGARGMRLCGAVGQLGSILGSLAIFALINYTQLFVQSDPCPHDTL